MLPAAKEIVEQLFTAGLIKLLFCTETFALGINMPARTVAIDELEKFDGVDFAYLMTRTFNQISGRAGRRGMDAEGYVYAQVLPEATDPREVERLLYGKNERINSRFIASYSTILTLYSRLGDACYGIFRKSLRNYRAGHFAITSGYQKEEGQIRSRIAFLQSAGFLNGTELTEKGELAAQVNGYEIQAAELYYSRVFERCSPAHLAVVVCALVTDTSSRSRRGVEGSAVTFHLSAPAEKVIHELRRREVRHSIATPVRELDFGYAGPMLAWAGGCSLNDLLSYGVPEGDLVRAMRMTVQILRTLRDAIPDQLIADRMHEAVGLVNRDVVDAQAELQVG
jgi:superfamily II RNA helicase